MKFQIIDLTHEDAPFFPPKGNGVRYMNSMDEFMEQFNDAWNKTNIKFCKYEDRQKYDENGDESLEHYLSGRRAEAIASLADGFEYEVENFKRLQERGAGYVRIRPYVEPLTPYLQWEIMSYQISAKLGQDIRLFDDAHIAKARREFCVSDFMLFDDHRAIVHNYTDEGLLVGGWLVSDQTHIKRYQTLFNRMLSVTRPLNAFLETHPELCIGNVT